jgi:hypothetical protein
VDALVDAPGRRVAATTRKAPVEIALAIGGAGAT